MRTRKFGLTALLTTVLGVGSALAEQPQQEPEEKSAVVHIEKPTEGKDYETVILDSDCDSKSLEGLLKKGEDDPIKKGAYEIKISRKPFMIYNFRAKEEEGKIALRTSSWGSGHVLNADGFFLTNYHVVMNCINNGDNVLETPLVVDFQTGLAEQAKILAYNPGFDLALGKIEIPPGKRQLYQDIPIKKHCLGESATVISLTFDDPKYMEKVILRKVALSVRAELDEKENIKFVQHGEVEDENVSFDGIQGQIITYENLRTFLEQKGARLPETRPSKEYFITPFQLRMDNGEALANKISPGNSGSAVYDVRGELCGILGSAAMVEVTARDQSGVEGKSLLYGCVNSKSIRSVIEDYIEAHNKKE